MTLPEVHLAGEAVAALVDGELTRGAYHRALTHLVRCTECRLAVQSQREAKSLLVRAGVPPLPGSLLSRLHDVPMTADLGDPGSLALDDGELVWRSGPPDPPNPPSPLDPPSSVPRQAGGRGPRGRRPHRPGADRPRSYPINRMHSKPLRRSLAGTLAGLAFGVLAAAVAPTGGGVTSPGQGGVNGGGSAVVPASVIGGVAPQERSRRERLRPADRSADRSAQVGTFDVGGSRPVTSSRTLLTGAR
ncbi:MAG TPA: hypothetical protein VLJ59_07745 [Mycobacteriales bacterium]|nr:hypothetical protein [Mycobacteriales bacterium]